TDRVKVDRKRRAVSVEIFGSQESVQAAFRDGLGCIVLGAEQSLADLEALPKLEGWPEVASADTQWPVGDLGARASHGPDVNEKALAAASEWAFQRPSPEQDTLSLLVVHRGKIVHERYAPGVDVNTRTRTWSTAKSIAVTLIGMLVDEGKLSLDRPLGVDWLPKLNGDAPDPRSAIHLRHVLNMSSGLYP
ncbi:MAG: serine hydrolase domain-containing protein, partial [Myxococcota bacterium]